jgi:hypothetical protein
VREKKKNQGNVRRERGKEHIRVRKINRENVINRETSFFSQDLSSFQIYNVLTTKEAHSSRRRMLQRDA